MAIITNIWSPDTCGCQIEFTWDDTQDPVVRAHVFSRTIVACVAHAPTAGLSTHYDTVLDRNRRKNLTFAQLLTVLASVTADQYATLWSYDAAQNVLTVNGTAAGLSANQRNNLQNKCNTQFGAGKVTVI
jgi:hypothetical protein